MGEGALLYVSNTETPWVREVATNQIYVLLSGRWFRAAVAERPLDVRAGRPAAADLREDPGRLRHRRGARVGGGHGGGRGRRPRRRDPEDDRHQPQRGEARRAVRGRAEVREDREHERFAGGEHPGPGAADRLPVLRRGQRRVVRGLEPEGAVGRGGLRARGPDPADPAELARVQHDLRARLPVDAAGRVRRLHAGLHVVLPVLRRARLRDGLLLPAVPGLLLPAPVHLRLPRRLQPVDGLELRDELERRLHALRHGLGRRLLRAYAGTMRRVLPRRLRRLVRRLPSRAGAAASTAAAIAGATTRSTSAASTSATT